MAAAVTDFPGLLPVSVTVVFPRTDDGVLSTSTHTVTTTLASLAITEFTNIVTNAGTKVLHSSCTATFTTAGGGTATNDAELNSLAQRMAADWYRWQLAKASISLAGTCAWVPDGLVDAVEWTWGKRPKTRIHRKPFNDFAGSFRGLHSGTGGSLNPTYQSDFYNANISNVTLGTVTNIQYTQTQITGDQNNYQLVQGFNFYNISSDAARVITGFVAGYDGQQVYVYNAGSFAITVNNQSGSSTAANRVITGTGANQAVPASTGFWMTYKAGSLNRWVMQGGNAQSAASGVAGAGTDDFLAEWTGAATLGNSGIWFDSSAIAYLHWILNDTSAPSIGTKRARIGPANLQNGDDLGYVIFKGYAGGGYGTCVTIKAVYTGDGSNVNGELAFISHVNGAGTEQARVTASGFKVTQATASKIAKLDANKQIIGQDLTVAELPTLWTDTATKTAAYTAANKENVLVDSNGAAGDFDVTLKASPSTGDRIRVTMVADHATRIVGINRNGSNVNGSTTVTKWKLCLEGDFLEFHYVGGDTGWAVTDGRQLHSAKMRRNSAQSINDATNTKVALNSQVYDVGGIADPTTNNQFVARRAGTMLVGCSVRMSTATWNTGERLIVFIYQGGAQVFAGELAPYDDVFQVPMAETTLEVALGDTIEMYMHQSSGAAVNTESGGVAEMPQMWVVELP